MPFMCLVHVDRDAIAALSADEREAFARANDAFAHWLEESRHIVLASSLHEPETATLLRHRGGRLSMTDGPYVETKEHLGGIMVLRTADRDTALAIAAKSPVARFGTIEVRAMNHPDEG